MQSMLAKVIFFDNRGRKDTRYKAIYGCCSFVSEFYNGNGPRSLILMFSVPLLFDSV